jgi:hypothetical protein
MENNLDNLQEDEVIIEDIDVDALETLDETLEQDITEAKVNPKEIDGEDDDDKEDDGEGLDNLGDEDSDVDNDGDSDEADEYLTKRRKTVAKKIAKEDTDINESEDDIDLTEASPFITHGTNRWRAYYPGAYSGTGYTKYFKDEASAKAWAAKKGYGTKVTKVSDVSKKDHDAIIKKGKEEMQKSGKNTVFIQHGSNTHTVAKINKKGEAGRHQEGGTYVRESLTVDESFESEDLQLDEAISDTLKDLITDFIGAAGDARSDENIDDILSKIKKQPGGEKIAKDLEDGFDKIRFGRSNNQNDGRPQDLSRAPGRITKAGKLNKTDAAKLKSIIKAKYGMKESFESEDLQLDEAISDTLKDLITDFIGAAGDARSDENIDDILSKIKKQPGGEKIAKDLEDGFDKIRFGRSNNQNDGRPQDLSRAPGRITKAGKLNKTDAAKLKSIIKAKYGMKESFESEDITRLIESEEGLTEEFKDKAAIIFEAAVSAKVNEIEATLSEQYETRLSEEVESVKSVLEEQVDSYLTYAVESWMEENKVAVESSLRTQLAENFISALKTVFVENYVDVPDSKVDLFAQLEAENNNLKEECAKFSRIAESLADRVDTLVREQIVTEASTGLADTQVDRLKKLVEDIEFVDAATYRKKVQTIKEFYLNGSQETEDTTLTEGADDSFISTETIVEGESMNDNLSPEMKSYLTALSRMNKAVTADLL